MIRLAPIAEKIIWESKGNKLKIQSGNNPTTVYHEVLCGLALKGSLTKYKSGDDILTAVNSSKIKIGVPGSLFKLNKTQIGYLENSTHKNLEALKTDAEKIALGIKLRIGSHIKSAPIYWAGPSNDSTDYGAADIVMKTKKHGWVGVSLKKGKGQLKNLTITSFFKALGVPLGTDGQAKTHFLEKYKSNWDAMTKDWVDLATKTFNSKINITDDTFPDDVNPLPKPGKTAMTTAIKAIFKKHLKTNWNDFQKEKISEGELNVLTASVGMDKITKDKFFKYFLYKLNQKYDFPGWNAKRTKHFADIFGKFETDYEGKIQVGLSELFERQMSVGKKNMFYAASAGHTIWFIPSQELFDKNFDPDSFIAQFRTEESGSGYNFILDIGHNDIRGIGTITVTFRFKQGQMVSFPDTTSNYKLYAGDWSKILGTFEK
jgi:hypothetical protein